MGLYAYALVSGSTLPPLGRGAWREALRPVRCGELLVVAGERRRAPAASALALGAQDEVLRRLMLRFEGVLPFRFGSFVEDAATMCQALRGRAATLRRALSRVRGCVQMTVALPAAARAPRGRARNGADYLRARFDAARAHELEPVRAELASLLRGERVERDARRVRVFHLVPAPKVDAYRRVLGELPAARVSGPSAAYAFGPEP